MSWWLMVLIGGLSMSVVMAVLWMIQRKTGDAGIVDVAWGLGVGALAVFFAIGSDGDPARRAVVATLTVIWAVRLSGYVLLRLIQLPPDGRYETLKEKWGPAANARMFGFYQLQAVGSLLFALPMLLASQSSAPFGVVDGMACAIWAVAFFGEALADRQLAKFRAAADNKGQVCRVGLWRYSRHPNYFFEWLHWWAYVAFAIRAPYGWLALLAPLTMWYLITRVTGIPPAEAQAIKSRGEAYREYQRTTSAFCPWPPKTPASQPASP